MYRVRQCDYELLQINLSIIVRIIPRLICKRPLSREITSEMAYTEIDKNLAQ